MNKRSDTPDEVRQFRMENVEHFQKSMNDFGSSLISSMSQIQPILKGGQSIEVKSKIPIHDGTLTYQCSLQFDAQPQQGKPKKSKSNDE